MESRYKDVVLSKLSSVLFLAGLILLYWLLFSLWGIDAMILPDAEQTIIHVSNDSASVIYQREYLYRLWLHAIGWINLTPGVLIFLQILLSATVLLFARPSISLIGIITFLFSFSFFSGTHNQFRAFFAAIIIFVIAHQKTDKYLIATLVGSMVHIKVGGFFGILAISRFILRKGYFPTSMSAAGLCFLAYYKQDDILSLIIDVGLSEIIISYSSEGSALPYPKIAVAALIYSIVRDKTGFASSPFSPATTIPLLILGSYLGGTGISERLAMALIIYYSLAFCSQINSLKKDGMRLSIFVFLNMYLIFTSQLWA